MAVQFFSLDLEHKVTELEKAASANSADKTSGIHPYGKWGKPVGCRLYLEKKTFLILKCNYMAISYWMCTPNGWINSPTEL